ncbi:MAG: transposase [Cellvibrionaceae bacterium]
MTRRYKKYNKEFKLNALHLMENTDKPITQIARELELRVNMLYKWRRELTEKDSKAFKRTESAIVADNNQALKEEVTRLNKQVKRLEAEKELLKKATAYFANEHT